MNRREPSYRHFLKPKYPTDKQRNERAKRSGNQERARSAEDRRCGTFLLLGKGRAKGRERGAASEPDAGDLAANLEDRDSNTKKR